MRLIITGFDQNTGLLAYTSQEVVYGPLSRTYSLRPPVVGFIEQARAHEVGSIVASVSIISAQYEALTEAERIIGRLYCNLYKGDLTDLIGIDYTTGVNGMKPADPNSVLSRAQAGDVIDIPTEDDIAYIEEQSHTLPQRKLFSAPGVFVSSWVFGDKTYLITDNKGLCVWVNDGESPAYVADSIKDAHGWIKGDVRNTLERLLR